MHKSCSSFSEHLLKAFSRMDVFGIQCHLLDGIMSRTLESQNLLKKFFLFLFLTHFKKLSVRLAVGKNYTFFGILLVYCKTYFIDGIPVLFT